MLRGDPPPADFRVALACPEQAKRVEGNLSKGSLMVEERHLNPLRELRPKQPHYLQRGRSGKLVRDWNLVVPASLARRAWEEIA